MDLNEYGSACRCLLRLRENEGEPVVSDRDFIRLHGERFPQWAKRPGELSAGDLQVLAGELGLAATIERTRDYDRLVAANRAGHEILVVTEHAPLQTGVGRRPHRTTSLVTEIDADGISLWWPDPEGHDETLSRADAAWWDRWQAVGLILHRASPEVAALAGDQVESGGVV